MKTNETLNKDMESGFKITDLILLESNFTRIANVTFNNNEIRPNVNVEVIVNVNNDVVIVTEKLVYTQVFNEIEEVKCTIVMSAIFEKIGETKIENLEQFGRINGASIIFPYIREHLSNLSLKAGLGLIVLPPLNFTISQ